jgi:hypothetical protein
VLPGLVGYLSPLVFRDPPATTPELARSFLPLRAQIPLHGHLGTLRAAAFSPDGKYLALAGSKSVVDCRSSSGMWPLAENSGYSQRRHNRSGSLLSAPKVERWHPSAT